VLIVDEAQLLVGTQFELIRQLLNFELNDRKLLQIVILGQKPTALQAGPKARARVAGAGAVDARPARFSDTRSMVEFRLMVAGRREPLFTDPGHGGGVRLQPGVCPAGCAGWGCTFCRRSAGRVQMIDEDPVTRVAEGLR